MLSKLTKVFRAGATNFSSISTTICYSPSYSFSGNFRQTSTDDITRMSDKEIIYNLDQDSSDPLKTLRPDLNHYEYKHSTSGDILAPEEEPITECDVGKGNEGESVSSYCVETDPNAHTDISDVEPKSAGGHTPIFTEPRNQPEQRSTANTVSSILEFPIDVAKDATNALNEGTQAIFDTMKHVTKSVLGTESSDQASNQNQNDTSKVNQNQEGKSDAGPITETVRTVNHFIRQTTSIFFRKK